MNLLGLLRWILYSKHQPSFVLWRSLEPECIRAAREGTTAWVLLLRQ